MNDIPGEKASCCNKGQEKENKSDFVQAVENWLIGYWKGSYTTLFNSLKIFHKRYFFDPSTFHLCI